MMWGMNEIAFIRNVIAGLVSALALVGQPAVAGDVAGPQPLDVLQDRRDDVDGAADGGHASSLQLGAAFEGGAAGITFRPPADCKQIRRAGVPDEIVQYLNEKEQWTLKVSRFNLEKKVPITTWVDDAGKEQDGVLENTIKTLQRANSGGEIVRQDVVNLDDKPVGLIGMRFAIGVSDRLLQQAIIQENELVYFVMEFASPGAKAGTPLDQDNPAERRAVEMFSTILDTVKLLDRTAIRRDQDERLYRTRALYVNINEQRLRAALIPEQWFRLIREGKDVGYSYVVEEPRKADGSPGVQIGIRARSVPEDGTQVDAESWLFMSFDRKGEDFSNIALYQSATQPRTYTSEFGSSIHRLKPMADTGVGGLNNKGVKLGDEYKIDVTYFGKSANAQPLSLDLPPYYLPQALGHLLPRLVPLNTPKTYMFASYVSDAHRVMMRYIDVGEPVNVKLGKDTVAAVPIKDRIGLEGTTTIHYMSLDGAYLGAVNAESKIMILPTDSETLHKLWKDADLSRPQVREPGPPEQK